MRRPLACLAVTMLAVGGSAVTATAAHADGVRGSQWYLDALGLAEAHQYSQGDGVTIGLLDSGVDASHPDLGGNIKPGKTFGEADGDATNDPDGHGTAAASLMVGRGDNDGILGIAPKAEVVPVGMHCQERECEGAQPGMWLQDGVSWLVEQDVDIIVASATAHDAGKANVDAALDADIPVIASAGNTGNSPVGHLGAPDKADTAWPARDAGVIPVTGITPADHIWSGGKDLSDNKSPHNGVAAPAADLPAATPGGHYATQSDSALAAAIAGGTLALIQSAHPGLDSQQSIERLTRSSADIGESGYDEDFGWGSVNPLRALTTEVEHDDGTISSQRDMLPLDDQVSSTDTRHSTIARSDAVAAENSAASSSPWALVLVTVGTVIAAAAITITLITLRRKRHAQVVSKRDTEHTDDPQ